MVREAVVAAPFVPSHKRRFKANKVFTDRERPVTLFLRAFGGGRSRL